MGCRGYRAVVSRVALRQGLRVAIALSWLMLVYGPVVAQAPPPIVVYGDANFPPYESLVDGQPVGANVELWRAIGRVLKRDIDIRLGPWAESQDKVVRGVGDALTFLSINE